MLPTVSSVTHREKHGRNEEEVERREREREKSPFFWYQRANLAHVVVFPDPCSPTNMITLLLPRRGRKGSLPGFSSLHNSSKTDCAFRSTTDTRALTIDSMLECERDHTHRRVLVEGSKEQKHKNNNDTGIRRNKMHGGRKQKTRHSTC